jgi:uncharacterized protein (TIGR03435 family)
MTAENISTISLIQQAFGIKEFQISGAPAWIASDKFDVIATYGTSRDLTDKELRPYLQSLLTDRFHLTFHRETKEVQIYSLTVVKTGARLTTHTGEGGSSTSISNGPAQSSLNSTNISMAALADLLGGRVDRIVVDHTDLPGSYDIKLEWAQNPSAESAVPSLFTALQEQLGLKLEATKGPVEIIAIDTIEKPSQN